MPSALPPTRPHPRPGTLPGLASHSGLSANVGTYCARTPLFEENIYVCLYLPIETLKDSLKTNNSDYCDEEPGT